MNIKTAVIAATYYFFSLKIKTSFYFFEALASIFFSVSFLQQLILIFIFFTCFPQPFLFVQLSFSHFIAAGS
jgi:hypothetical protein